MRSRSSRTARATSSVFAFEICSTPMLMPNAVAASDGALVLGGETHVGDLAQPHEIAALAPADHELAEILLGVEAGLRAA